MIIEKDGKVYIVRENKSSWTIKRTVEILTVNYKIQKSDCPTFEDVKKFVMETDLG